MGALVASLCVLASLVAAAAPASGAVWPGGGTVSLADDADTFGKDVSGLAYQASGSAEPGTAFAVRNSPSLIYRLLLDDGTWTPDTANGWGAGKQLRYGDGTGAPDSEGVTFEAGDPNTAYVAVERNDVAGERNTSRPGILRYDVSGSGASLNATQEFDMTADVPGLEPNEGFEALTWVPDTVLVSKGLLDEATDAAYNPATYPNHGTGLFLAGVEQNGLIIAYALNLTSGAFTRVARIESGLPHVMGLEYDAGTTYLWAACDDSCRGVHTALDIAQSGADDGRFVVTNTFERPAGMPDVNNEGLAIAAQAECAGGVKPILWADDSDTDSHALRASTLSCAAPPADTTVDGSAGAKKTQKQGRKIVVKATVDAVEALTANATGTVKAGKDYALKALDKPVDAGTTMALTLKPAKPKFGDAILRALEGGKKVTAKVTVKLTDHLDHEDSTTVHTRLK